MRRSILWLLVGSSYRRDFFHAVENHLGHEWRGADARRAPNEFAVASGGVVEGRFARLGAFLYFGTRFAEQDRQIFPGMHPVTDEERHHDDVWDVGDTSGVADMGLFFDERSVDFGERGQRAKAFCVPLGGAPGIAILVRPVGGENQRDVARARWFRCGCENLVCPSEDDISHSWAGADGLRVEQRLLRSATETREHFVFSLAKSELSRNDLRSEVTVAEEKRHREDTRRLNCPDSFSNERGLLPKANSNVAEQVAIFESGGVTHRGDCRFRVHGRSMRDQQKRGVRERSAWHGTRVSHGGQTYKNVAVRSPFV